jgi:hypothetical protein
MKNKSVLQNETGLATIETVPLLAIFLILLAYSFGSFGIIHTGILNSIAARTYAFEIMRGRANVTYFRDAPGFIGNKNYKLRGNRIHGIRHELRPGDTSSDFGFRSTERPLRIGLGAIPADASRTNDSIHNQRVFDGVREQVQTTVGVSPAWVMTQYGMCLNANCGGN